MNSYSNKIWFTFLLIVCLTGCDVPGTIEIKNNLNEDIKVSYSFQNTDEDYKPHSNQIKPNEKGLLILGFGTRWDDSFINHYPIEIIDTVYLNVGETIYYCSSPKCKKMLFNTANRKSKRKMTITINNELVDNSFVKN